MSNGVKRRQLGRGLSSLLGTDAVVEDARPKDTNQFISKILKNLQKRFFVSNSFSIVL